MSSSVRRKVSTSSLFRGGEGQARKILRNGQIFILRGDKTYTLTGDEVQ